MAIRRHQEIQQVTLLVAARIRMIVVMGGNPWNSGSFNNYGYGAPRPQMMTMQAMPYGYPMYGYSPMQAIPMAPQAPSYQEVVERQEAMRNAQANADAKPTASTNALTQCYN